MPYPLALYVILGLSTERSYLANTAAQAASVEFLPNVLGAPNDKLKAWAEDMKRSYRARRAEYSNGFVDDGCGNDASKCRGECDDDKERMTFEEYAERLESGGVARPRLSDEEMVWMRQFFADLPRSTAEYAIRQEVKAHRDKALMRGVDSTLEPESQTTQDRLGAFGGGESRLGATSFEPERQTRQARQKGGMWR